MSKKVRKASRKRYEVTLVPHTHWDRAWYVPFEEFRRRLVRLTDRLIHILTTDDRFTCFVLDGQTVVLVTHDPNVAARATSWIRMDDGSVVERRQL